MNARSFFRFLNGGVAKGMCAALIALIAGSLFAAEPITNGRLLSDASIVSLTVAGQEIRFKAEPGNFWNYLLTSGDGLRAFAISERGKFNQSWYSEEVCEFVPSEFIADPKGYRPRRIPLIQIQVEGVDKQSPAPERNAPLRKSVQKIFSSSKDGSRLLVLLRADLAKGTRVEMPLNDSDFSWHMRPCFFSTQTGVATPVTP